MGDLTQCYQSLTRPKTSELLRCVIVSRVASIQPNWESLCKELFPADWPVGVSTEVVLTMLIDVGGLSLKVGDLSPGFGSLTL